MSADLSPAVRAVYDALLAERYGAPPARPASDPPPTRAAARPDPMKERARDR